MFCCYLIEQILFTQLCQLGLKAVTHFCLQCAGHPDESLHSAITRNELCAGDVHLAHTRESRGLQSAANLAGQCRELHANGCHSREVAVDNHHAIRFGHDRGDTFEAAARRHGLFHEGIGIELREIAVRLEFDKVVHAFPLSFQRVYAFAFQHRAIGAVLIDPVRCFAIQPRICSTEPQAFRGYDTHMVRRIRLTQHAGIELLDVLVLHAADAIVPGTVFRSCLFKRAFDRFGVRNESHLHAINNRREVVVNLRHKDLTKVLYGETFRMGVLANSEPDDRALTHMEDAVRAGNILV